MKKREYRENRPHAGGLESRKRAEAWWLNQIVRFPKPSELVVEILQTNWRAL